MALLAGLTQAHLEGSGEELDELIAAGLVVETDPETLGLLRELDRLAGEHAEHFRGSSGPWASVKAALADVEEKLKDDWFRMKRSKGTLREMEDDRVALRRVLGALSHPDTAARLQKTAGERVWVAPGAGYVPCPQVGSAIFAITARGRRVLDDLAVRAERCRDAKLKTFLAQHDKADAKLEAFCRDVRELSERVGYVRKHKAHVVVGLVKSNLPAQQAAGVYASALRHAHLPDVAVTCTRNAAREGSTGQVQRKLADAYQALLRAGFPPSMALQSAAKSLLPYDPPHAGVPRFSELCYHLGRANVQGEALIKLAARLMPAGGTPAELVQRAFRAAQRLASSRSAARARRCEMSKACVALASMAAGDAVIDELCERFLAIERALVESRLCSLEAAEDHALECVGCPGTPPEVAATVAGLTRRLAAGGTMTSEHLTIAAAFAKRFAY